MRKLITVIGTTGVGKSKLSVTLARALNGEVINGDSMQVYHGLDTITNKHPIEEQFDIPHHLLGHETDRSQEYTIHRFEKEVEEKVISISDRMKVPILVGGTHYYIQSVLFKNRTVTELQKRALSSEEEYFMDTAETKDIFERLRQADPSIASKFHPRDRRKLRTALTMYFTTGLKPSDIYRSQKEDPKSDSRYKSLVFWVWSDQTMLDKRLDMRVDKMIQEGNMLDEIKEMSDLYKSLEPKPIMENGIWQVIGFKEFLPYIDSLNHENRDTALDEVKKNTRKYARTQVKWIRRKFLVAAKECPEDVVVVLLNATDLSKWEIDVENPAIAIAKDFLNDIQTQQNIRAPYDLQHLLQAAQEKDNSAQPEDWQHFKCDICKDKFGDAFVCVGSERWKIHLNSRKHKQFIRYLSKKSEFEKWNSGRKSKDDAKKLSSTKLL
ncbi:IPP transferase-domain-containing protein [Lipomyces japonicus]|uniref:IPP transferase-domain-containing protein n=1 Tax=Lipomyces japonicus TaxID=56871 RepID=UPI0034CFAED1